MAVITCSQSPSENLFLSSSLIFCFVFSILFQLFCFYYFQCLGTGAASGYGSADATAAGSYGGPGPQRGGSYSSQPGQASGYHPYRRM